MLSSNTAQLRKHHPAWQLLAATKGPLLIAVLQELFKDSPDGIEFDSAVLELAQLLRQQYEQGETELEDPQKTPQGNTHQEARKEIRHWIKRGLLIERQGRILATDALESALRFVQGLEQRIMSSSASRLAIVQREIEHLDANLNANPIQRSAFLENKIADLQTELAAVEQGHIEVLSEEQAVESIREIYSLATSLTNDFRRVEDSYREADKNLRQSIITEQNNRGDIVDKLLDSHDKLLSTAEGKVFNGFHLQLTQALELEKMKQQLRTIVAHPSSIKALNSQQQSDLRWLIMRLVMESERVVKARARSEKDVRGFLKTGLAAEHHRVGQLLNDLFAEAMGVDWSSQKLRRSDSPLPPIAIANNGLPLAARIRFKQFSANKTEDLDLLPQEGHLNELDNDFWESFDGLNQAALLADTQALLAQYSGDMGIAELAEQLPPSHDLEAITLWLSMAMASERVDAEQIELADIIQSNGSVVRFSVPKVSLNHDVLKELDFEV